MTTTTPTFKVTYRNTSKAAIANGSDAWAVIEANDAEDASRTVLGNLRKTGWKHVSIVRVEPIKSDSPDEICRYWVAKLGLGFHPDTRGKDYRPRLSAADVARYDRDMVALFDAPGDPYAYAVEAMEEVAS